MRMFFSALATLVVLALPFAASPALAFDENAFLEQLESSIVSGDISFGFGSTQGDEDSFSINDVMIENPEKNRRTKIETITFTGIEGDEAVGFSFEDLNASGYNQTNTDTSLVSTIRSISATGLGFNRGNPSDLLPASASSITFSDIAILPEGDRSKGSFTLPRIEIVDFTRGEDETVSFAQARVSSFTGRSFNSDGDPVDMTFDGLRIDDFKRFGETGFDVGFLELGPVAVNGVGKQGPFSISFGGLNVENYYVAGTGDDARPFIADNTVSATINPLSISVAGTEIFSWAGAESVSENDRATKTSKSRTTFRDISIDLAAIPQEGSARRSLQPIFELGYERISANIFLEAATNLAAGTMSLSRLELDLVEAGKIN
ncbi:MAG: hypothetical protein AAFN43_11335, partial [Pseudomonadota bacterium]